MATKPRGLPVGAGDAIVLWIGPRKWYGPGGILLGTDVLTFLAVYANATATGGRVGISIFCGALLIPLMLGGRAAMRTRSRVEITTDTISFISSRDDVRRWTAIRTITCTRSAVPPAGR
jgi:hypothetical protein